MASWKPQSNREAAKLASSDSGWSLAGIDSSGSPRSSRTTRGKRVKLTDGDDVPPSSRPLPSELVVFDTNDSMPP